MARRDVRRHRGRSALIVLMVFLPVVAVIGGVVVVSSQQVSASEATSLTLGGAVASITVQGDGTEAVDQAATIRYLESCRPSCADGPPVTGAAVPVAGWTSGHEAGALQGVTGGAVLRVTSSSEKVLGTRQFSVRLLGVDGSTSPWLAPRVALLSGHWPTSATEVLVTRVGMEHGIPASGTVTVVHEEPAPSQLLPDAAAGLPPGSASAIRTARTAPPTTTHVLTVVGSAAGYVSAGPGDVQPADLVTLPDAIAPVRAPTDGSSGSSIPSVEYLLDRAAPLSASEVAGLNRHGLHVLDSRIGTEDASRRTSDPEGALFAAFTALAAVGLLLLTSLIAGPAFAVSAARQRRTLALTASNGGTRAQVRRTVLAQALVLGVLAALLGGAVGLTGSWLLVHWLTRHRAASWWGPFDAPWVPATIVVGSAVVSSVVAAVLPARGLGRLDIVRVIRGQEVSPKLHRSLPLVGLGLLVTGTLLLSFGFVNSVDTSNPRAAIGITSGVVVLVVGALCVIPAALTLLGRLTRGMPVTVRMATRDAARQRGRATPTVAAVMACTAVLTTLLTVVASSARHGELVYQPGSPPGTFAFYGGDEGHDPGAVGTATVAAAARAASGVDPSLRVSRTYGILPVTEASGAGRVIGALRTDCPVSAVADQSSPFPTDTSTQARCTSLNSSASSAFTLIVVADADYLTRALALDAAQRAALDAGSMLVVDGVGKPAHEVGGGGNVSPSVTAAEGTVDLVGGSVTMVDASVVSDTSTGAASVVGTPKVTRVRAFAVPRVQVAGMREPGAVVTPATAEALGWPLTPTGIVGYDPGGTITSSTEDALGRALGKELPGTTVYVERGYTGDASSRLTRLIALAVVAFLTLVATLIATALSQAESQAFLGTLAAVGATRGTRRRIAGAQAGFLALAGVLLGVLVGLVPGILMARATTGPKPYDEVPVPATLVIPWLELLAPVVVVPLVAALLAWASIRATPTVTRRLS